MNLKYIGEAVALVGIASVIMRWVLRTVADADAPPTTQRGVKGHDRGPHSPESDDTTPS